jgi:hypothetical protein
MAWWDDMLDAAGAHLAGIGLTPDEAGIILTIPAATLTASVFAAFRWRSPRTRRRSPWSKGRRLDAIRARAAAERPVPAARPAKIPVPVRAVATGKGGAPAAESPVTRSVVSGCGWRRDGYRPGTRFMRWMCVECGLEGYTRDESPPRECKRALRRSSL